MFVGLILLRQSVLKWGGFNQIADAGDEINVQGQELGSDGPFQLRIFCDISSWLALAAFQQKSSDFFSLISGGDKTLTWKFSFGWSGSAQNQVHRAGKGRSRC